jgi:phosphoribosylglycinamide formyltransferase-1
MYTFGWFSTGRDEAARELLTEAWKGTQDGTIPARIQFVFCNREPGENRESDRFIQLVRDLRIPLFSLSSRRFDPPLRKKDREAWRRSFDGCVTEILGGQNVPVVVLAGYMLIVSPEMCRRFTMINLHPAEPGGPKGSWQQVIWELIASGAERTGVIIHLVTEALDEGPPITYCTFPLTDKPFDALWVEMGVKLGFTSLGDIIQEEGKKNPLFREIRNQGVMREIPLLLMTMKALAEGKVRVKGGKILDETARETGSLCLNREVEDYLRRPGHL